MSPVYSGAVTKLSPPKKVLNNLIFFGVWCWRTHSSPRWNDNTSRGAARSWKQIKQVNSRSGPSFSTAPRGHQRTESAVMTTNLLTCESTTVMEDDSWFWSRPSSSFQCFKLFIVILSSTYPQSETFGQERTKDRTKSENMQYLIKILWGYFTKQKERS